MRIITFLLPIFPALIFLGIACNKEKQWLDVKSNKTQAIPSTLEDFQKLMDNSNSQMNYYGPFLGEIASDGHYILNTAWLGNLKDEERNAYTWSHERPYLSNISVTVNWNTPYTNIFVCNVVLEGLNKIKPDNSDEFKKLNDIRGQALFNRSFVFYSCAQIWAPHFNSNTAVSDLSIPLRLESDVTIPSKRSSVQETYDQIINDLKVAYNILPETSVYPTRGSQISAAGLLARVYLSIGNYDSALAYSNISLSNYNTLIDYNNLSKSSNFIGNYTTNSEVIFHYALPSGYSSITTNCLIEDNLFSLYDSSDLRKIIFFRKNSNGTISYKGNYNNTATRLFCGLATDEIYLIRAECLARLNDKNAAMNDLNTLLQKRWANSVTYVPLIANNSEDALIQILTERRKELLLRGLRWIDLRRLNQDSRFQITLTRTIGGKTYNLNPNDYRYTFPIPDDVIEKTDMEQNPSW